MTEQTAQHVRFAVSKAGHDKGTLYCVTGETPEAYFLSDGKTRRVARPKKKNRKHVQLILHIPEEIRRLCLQGGAFYDEGIRYALKMWSRLNEKE